MISASLCGCVVEDTIYLQKVDVAGPVIAAPVHIATGDGERHITLSPSLQVQQKSTVDGSVGAFQSPYSLGDQSLHWQMPALAGGIDLNLPIAQSVDWSFGFNLGAGNGEQLAGLSTGIAVLSRGESSVGRFEFGMQWQTTHFDALSVVEHKETSIFGGSSTTIGYFHDIRTSMPMSLYGSILWQSIGRDRPVNFFGQFAYCSQTITAFVPTTQIFSVPPLFTYVRTDTRTSSTAHIVSLTPGIYADLTPHLRLVAGTRLLYEFGVSSNGSSLMVHPLVQCDVVF